jgi:hypothetical protein
MAKKASTEAVDQADITIQEENPTDTAKPPAPLATEEITALRDIARFWNEDRRTVVGNMLQQFEQIADKVNASLPSVIRAYNDTVRRLEQENALLREGKPLPLPREKYEELLVPLPPEAVTTHPTKDFLSSIKTIYMVERLNDVFGVDGWFYTADVVEAVPDKAMIVVKVTLTVPRYGIVKEAFGGNDNKDRGDAYKGAVTDALSKISGMMGIGIDVYKGFGPTTKNGGRRTLPRAQQNTGSAAAATTAQPDVIPPCDDCKGVIRTIEVGGDPYSPQDLVANSQRRWKLNLCGACQKKRRDAERAGQRPAAAPTPAPVPAPAAPANGTPGPIR